MGHVDLSARGKEIFSRARDKSGGWQEKTKMSNGESQVIGRRGGQGVLEIYDNICWSRTGCEMKFQGYATFAEGEFYSRSISFRNNGTKILGRFLDGGGGGVEFMQTGRRVDGEWFLAGRK